MGRDKKNKHQIHDPETPVTQDAPPPVTGEKFSEPIEGLKAAMPVFQEVTGATWRSAEFETRAEIVALFNSIESLGYRVTSFDFERKLGGVIELIYRVEVKE